MALSDLTTKEMVQISALWVTPPGKDAEGNDILTYRPLIESVPLLAGMLEYLEEAHYGLAAFSETEEPKAPTNLQKVQDEQKFLDKRHDTLIRSLYRLFGLLADLTDDPELREKLLAMRKRLFPEGLSATRRSYTEEAGAVRQLEERLTPEDKAFLASVTIEIQGRLSTNTFVLVEELINKGKRIGDLDVLKEKFAKEGPTQPSSLSEYQLGKLWVTHVTTFIRLVETAKISKEDKEKLLEMLYRLEEEATKRAAEKRAAEQKASEQKPSEQEPAEQKAETPSSEAPSSEDCDHDPPTTPTSEEG